MYTDEYKYKYMYMYMYMFMYRSLVSALWQGGATLMVCVILSTIAITYTEGIFIYMCAYVYSTL